MIRVGLLRTVKTVTKNIQVNTCGLITCIRPEIVHNPCIEGKEFKKMLFLLFRDSNSILSFH